MHESLPDDQICHAFIICILPPAVRCQWKQEAQSKEEEKRGERGGLVMKGTAVRTWVGLQGQVGQWRSSAAAELFAAPSHSGPGCYWSQKEGLGKPVLHQEQ